MTHSLRRILAMLIRYLYLHQRSLPRILEIVFWPVMDLLVWGFVSLYIQSLTPSPLGTAAAFLMNAMIFWDILYRSQQAVSMSIMEEIWNQNMMNILVSPLKIWEWITATFLYGLLKSTVITLVLCALAYAAYRFNMIGELGLWIFPLAGNLLLFGWIVGIFTAAMLFRWGYAAEALIWGIPFLIQPISAAFYPLSVLPLWLQKISLCVPSTHVFEGMRTVLRGETLGWKPFFTALGLNAIFFILALLFFQWMYRRALDTGRLVRLGMD